MSIEERSAQSDAAAGSGKVGVALDETSQIASDAAGSAKQLASEAAGQASDVLAETKQQLTSLLDQTKSELHTQLDARGSQAAQGLQTLSSQLRALGEGRTGDAGPLADYVQDAQRRVQRFASRLEEGGSQGLLQDATSFARRRPAAFLFGAALAGFALGRIVRATAAVAHDDGHADATDGSIGGRALAEPQTPMSAQGTYAEPAEAPYADHGSGVSER